MLAGKRPVAQALVHVPAVRPAVIALVTDDDDLREACVRALACQQYIVYAARHSGHAMLACLAGQPIDLLIAELCMSDGSGPGLMRRMRHHCPNLRSLYIARAGAAVDADNVLVRPFTRDDLLTRIDAALRRRE